MLLSSRFSLIGRQFLILIVANSVPKSQTGRVEAPHLFHFVTVVYIEVLGDRRCCFFNW